MESIQSQIAALDESLKTTRFPLSLLRKADMLYQLIESVNRLHDLTRLISSNSISTLEDSLLLMLSQGAPRPIRILISKLIDSYFQKGLFNRSTQICAGCLDIAKNTKLNINSRV